MCAIVVKGLKLVTLQAIVDNSGRLNKTMVNLYKTLILSELTDLFVNNPGY